MTFGYLVYLVFRSWPVKDRPCLLCLLWCLWQIRSRLAVLWRHRPCTVWSSQSDKGVSCDVCGRYALDWLYSEGIVRVLCGSHSQVTCTLKLHVNYPTVRNVTLQSATGLPSDFNLDTIQVRSTISTLYNISLGLRPHPAVSCCK